MKIKTIQVVAYFFITQVLLSCNNNPANDRLDQLDIIISRWEKQLQNKPVYLNEMIMIQKDVTMYDVDPRIFAATYGDLSSGQKERIYYLKSRFKKLMRQ